MRLKYLSNHHGFTLIEMTIVLMIVTVVTSISFGNFQVLNHATIRNQVIDQLKQDLYFAQQRAISHNTLASVVFLNGSREYVIRQGGNVIVRRSFPKNVVFIGGTLSLNDVAFLQDGNNRKAGSLMIRIEKTEYRLVMLLGRGRFYIEQL